jgi:hypothetical protein
MNASKIVAALGAAAAGSAAWAGVAVANAGPAAAPTQLVISTTGVGSFSSNGFFKETVRFSKSSYTIASGGTLTFEKGPRDKTVDPHTLTAVSASQVPKTATAVEECLGGAPGTGCAIGDAAKGPILNAGKPGFNQPGDSLQFGPGPYGASKPVTVKVTAPAGTTLNLICAVHPWMQATLHVVG